MVKKYTFLKLYQNIRQLPIYYRQKKQEQITVLFDHNNGKQGVRQKLDKTFKGRHMYLR